MEPTISAGAVRRMGFATHACQWVDARGVCNTRGARGARSLRRMGLAGHAPQCSTHAAPMVSERVWQHMRAIQRSIYKAIEMQGARMMDAGLAARGAQWSMRAAIKIWGEIEIER